MHGTSRPSPIRATGGAVVRRGAERFAWLSPMSPPSHIEQGAPVRAERMAGRTSGPGDSSPRAGGDLLHALLDDLRNQPLRQRSVWLEMDRPLGASERLELLLGGVDDAHAHGEETAVAFERPVGNKRAISK